MSSVEQGGYGPDKRRAMMDLCNARSTSGVNKREMLYITYGPDALQFSDNGESEL